MNWFRVGVVQLVNPTTYFITLTTAANAQISRTQPGVNKDGLYEFEIEVDDLFWTCVGELINGLFSDRNC